MLKLHAYAYAQPSTACMTAVQALAMTELVVTRSIIGTAVPQQSEVHFAVDKQLLYHENLLTSSLAFCFRC